jgi:hypothetical protein
MSWRPLVGLIVLLPALAGCLSPAGPLDSAGADGALPPVVLPEVISAIEPLANVPFGGGNDLAFEGNFAYVASHGSGMHIVDITDPANPVEVAVVECNGKDIDVIQLETRRIVVIASQGDDGCPDAAPSGGIRLVDVTDATQPVVLGQVALQYGAHTMTPYGDTGLIYNSAYDLANPLAYHKSEIIDVSNPDDPKLAGAFAFPQTSLSPGCHDILAEPERDRAICAGITETMIWDTTDPMAPKVVSTIHNPLINIHHSAATARDGELLILGDEFGGALAPACNPSGQGPTGAVFFFDISNPASPQMLGFLPPPAGGPGKVCTAHNFNVIEDRDLMVAAFYTGGTLLIDFSDPASPKALSQQAPTDGSAWASYYYRGAVYSGDGGLGLNVYKLV